MKSPKRTQRGSIVNVYETLLERFGEPIGSYAGRLDGPRDERSDHCSKCGGMMQLESTTCEKCGVIPEANYEEYMLGLDKDENSLEAKEKVEKMFEAKPLVNRPKKNDEKTEEMKPELEDYDPLDEKSPPGGQKVVRALKKAKGVENPFAVAWAMKKKGQF